MALIFSYPMGMPVWLCFAPLEGARSNIRQAGLEEKVECRLSDGMQALLQGEVSGCVIAGMGGDLTLRILQAYPEKTASLKELVLSPQSEVARVRRWLRLNSWLIEDEEMVLEDGKFYTVIRAILRDHLPKEEGYILEDFYGPVLLQKKHPVLDAYLTRELKIQQQILSGLAGACGEDARRRREEVLAVCARNEEAGRLIRV
ncbi:MAG: SAM-dependent methyltransferase [Lachnospiraceae bacterium]|nr:SAM-dependent methyltransferase [Lachnospiraceae bacterium]